MNIMPALPVDAVQAFLLVAEFQSFTRAADALGTSQAAISLKLKRLENQLGQELLERTPRLVRLSARGAAFLGPAREFVAAHERALAGLVATPRKFTLGISDQFAGPGLPTLLARLHAHDPALVMEVQVGASRQLLDAFDHGDLDAAIVRKEDDRRDGEVLAKEPFGWFAGPSFAFRKESPLRLASVAQTCGIRSIATRALDRAGIPWHEVFVGGGMAAVAAAVSAGLAVAPLARGVAPAGALDVGDAFGLPRLPPATVVLHSTVSDPRSRDALRVLSAAFREHRHPGG
jgi:DNA-binding transcriptional LysR family regulator